MTDLSDLSKQYNISLLKTLIICVLSFSLSLFFLSLSLSFAVLRLISFIGVFILHLIDLQMICFSNSYLTILIFVLFLESWFLNFICKCMCLCLWLIVWMSVLVCLCLPVPMSDHAYISQISSKFSETGSLTCLQSSE